MNQAPQRQVCLKPLPVFDEAGACIQLGQGALGCGQVTLVDATADLGEFVQSSGGNTLWHMDGFEGVQVKRRAGGGLRVCRTTIGMSGHLGIQRGVGLVTLLRCLAAVLRCADSSWDVRIFAKTVCKASGGAQLEVERGDACIAAKVGGTTGWFLQRKQLRAAEVGLSAAASPAHPHGPAEHRWPSGSLWIRAEQGGDPVARSVASTSLHPLQ